jgi:hypothetical protein
LVTTAIDADYLVIGDRVIHAFRLGQPQAITL